MRTLRSCKQTFFCPWRAWSIPGVKSDQFWLSPVLKVVDIVSQNTIFSCISKQKLGEPWCLFSLGSWGGDGKTRVFCLREQGLMQWKRLFTQKETTEAWRTSACAWGVCVAQIWNDNCAVGRIQNLTLKSMWGLRIRTFCSKLSSNEQDIYVLILERGWVLRYCRAFSGSTRESGKGTFLCVELFSHWGDRLHPFQWPLCLLSQSCSRSVSICNMETTSLLNTTSCTLCI